MCECIENAVFVGDVMMTAAVYILVCVCGFPINCGDPLVPTETKVSKMGRILVGWGLHCELYVGVEGIKVGKELLVVFCLVDNKSVIYIPKQNPGSLGRFLTLWL